MEGAKTVSVGAVYVPNSYRIHLSQTDQERFGGLIPTLRHEFAALLRKNAAERHWQFPGPLVVDFLGDPAVESGRFEVFAAHDADAVAPADLGPREVVRLLGDQPGSPAGKATKATKEWVLSSGRLVIGRLPSCDLSLNDQNASRQHAEFVEREDGWWIVDLDSTNGTFVNGSLVKERRLNYGDRIQIGSSRLEFAQAEPAPEGSRAPGDRPGVASPTESVSKPPNAD